MKKIEWKTEKRKVSKLVPADYNPRKITQAERQDLLNSINEFGAVIPVVVNTNNTIIGGHQRISIYADLGYEEIDVMIPNRKLSLEEEMRLNIRLNKNTGGWDQEKLSEMDIEMLLDVGFKDEELSEMWDNIDTIDQGRDLAKDIKKAKETKVKKGDIYQLGEHRVMCGSSLDEKDVEKLMDGKKTKMIYCDPPYNIGLDYSKGTSNGPKHRAKKVYREEESAFKNDKKTNEDYRMFLKNTMQNALKNSQDNFHIFYWCDEKYIGLIQDLYEELGIVNRRVCMWIKNNFNLTPQIAFNKVYEPCVYGTRGKPFLNTKITSLNEVMNKEVLSGNQVHDEIYDLFNIWLVKRDNSNDYDHPTQKPITLHEKAIKRCSVPGDIILDLFGGSGSTLMSCEQLNRKAYIMELDPIFIQVIITRYEETTGKKAKKIS